MPSVAIIDYGSGNLRSAEKALQEAAGSDVRITVTNDPSELKTASHIVLPGVGAFADCIGGLTAIPGMRDALEEEVIRKKKYFLGICVGMQMMLERGQEHGVHAGLGWIKGEVVKLGTSGEERGANDTSSLLASRSSPLKIPHMGWNELSILQKHPLLNGIETGAHAYFVHSYHAQCVDKKDVVATTDYGQTITAVIARENIMGTQFHPEKSQAMGLRLLKNFMAM